MIIDIFPKIKTQYVLSYDNNHNCGANVVDISIKKTLDIFPLNNFQLYTKIMNECKRYEFSVDNVMRKIMLASNDIYKDSMRGSGNHCVVSQSFVEVLTNAGILFKYDTTQIKDYDRILFHRCIMDVMLLVNDPVCIMTYNGSVNDFGVFDSPIGVRDDGKLLFIPGWQRYIRIITNSNNEINHAWKMFIGDKNDYCFNNCGIN